MIRQPPGSTLFPHAALSRCVPVTPPLPRAPVSSGLREADRRVVRAGRPAGRSRDRSGAGPARRRAPTSPVPHPLPDEPGDPPPPQQRTQEVELARTPGVRRVQLFGERRHLERLGDELRALAALGVVLDRRVARWGWVYVTRPFRESLAAERCNLCYNRPLVIPSGGVS